MSETELLIGLVSGAMFALVTLALVKNIGWIGDTPRKYRPRFPRRGAPANGPRSVLTDQKSSPTGFGEQLDAVMKGDFRRRRVLSYAEYRVFRVIESDPELARTGYRTFAQVNLGQLLDAEPKEAFHAINSKRVDILVVDQGGWPKLAVEYQGAGHYQGTAAARDAIKKEALRKAKVHYREVSDSDTDDQIRRMVRECLGLPPPAASPAPHDSPSPSPAY